MPTTTMSIRREDLPPVFRTVDDSVWLRVPDADTLYVLEYEYTSNDFPSVNIFHNDEFEDFC